MEIRIKVWSMHIQWPGGGIRISFCRVLRAGSILDRDDDMDKLGYGFDSVK